ncbi:MAG TPA: hypothetical protein VGZ68_10495 [Acidimicrobiales bacterium]|jgi:chloramphenicol 3-O phosphotransferase|nr:hypothetical protein [Acidimicrobiales bacterium]
MSATMIVLNGASSAGKTSIARALQDLWPRPLLVTGIDSFLSGWPRTFLNFPGDDGTPAAPSVGLRVVRGLGPEPSWILESGEEFHKLMRLAHRTWATVRDAGIDQVVDLALFDETLRLDASDVLRDAFWVGVTCEIDELVRREAIRGDRPQGFASGTSVVVHQGMHYDLMVDSTMVTSEELADKIVNALPAHS